MKRFFTSLFAVILLNACVFAAENVHVTIQPETVVNTIDLKVYGHFLEHIYNSCNGGLWGELVWNRSFEAGNVAGWTDSEGVYTQKARGNQILLLGDPAWTDYEVTMDAKKLSGAEGFLVLFHAKDGQFYWANLGGWHNSRNGFVL